MWFAASESPYRNPWFGDLLFRLPQGAPPVLALLADNPFPGEQPKWVCTAPLTVQRGTTRSRTGVGA
jgi:Lipase maturation factor